MLTRKAKKRDGASPRRAAKAEITTSLSSLTRRQLNSLARQVFAMASSATQERLAVYLAVSMSDYRYQLFRDAVGLARSRKK